ncbi:MAG: inositol monophosphatase family protein [Granulosicoccaceae bacterium]
MNNQQLTRATEAAVQACEAANSEINRFLGSGDWSVSNKPDNTPVTEVDVAAELAIKKILLAAELGADFYGEETGLHAAEHSPANDQTRLLWLVDPIDGTKSFVRQSPFYSTQIALMKGDELVLGVSNAPAYGERLLATIGQGAQLNGKLVFCNAEIQMNEAYLSTGNLTSLAADVRGWTALGRLIGQVKRTRGYGDFCHYHQLCCGHADIVIESDVNILDIAALYVSVTEAGGVMTDLAGNAITQETTSVLAAANAPLHKAVLALFNG